MTATALTPHIEPLVHALGLDLEEVEVSKAGRRSVVRILVDVDGGVSLDQIAELTREVSARIDAEPAFGEQPFTLEVSSPGVDRPLTLPRHWRRNIGRLVTITPNEGDKFTGRIAASNDTSVDVEIEGAIKSLAFDAIKRAKVEVEFNREARS